MTQKLAAIAKNLRKNSTDAERLLWRQLRAKQIQGCKFRRQEPTGNYVVDFICFEKRLVVEVDGGQHAIEIQKDRERDDWFKKEGFKVLRFWNNEVLGNIEGVLQVITRGLSLSPHPTLPHKGGGEKKQGEL